MVSSSGSSIVVAADVPSSTLNSRVRRGQLARLAPGVYTSDVASTPERVVRREWHTIVGHLYPAGVITDRSAVTGGAVEGVLYLAHDGRERDTQLSGLLVRARRGSGPLRDDAPLPGGLYQASKGRALIENTAASRARAGRTRRTLSERELGDWIDHLAIIDGPQRLQHYRAAAEQLAPDLGASAERAALVSRLAGVALGTRQARSASPALQARQAGQPYDADRVKLFGVLIEALRRSAPQNNPVADPGDPSYRHLPFFEAYFSNFIEGTEFEVSEAEAIIYAGKQIPGRADDSHDLIGTFRVVDDLADMSHVAADAGEFAQLLRARHSLILAGRPEHNPGTFKEIANRAGGTSFVLPGLVEGTLRAGWTRMAELDTAFERAVYTMFLVSEVHPFDDGNGRVARVMMNAELVAGGQTRIIIPTVYREDYLGALRRLSRQDDPTVLIKALRYANDYTAQIPWQSHTGARDALASTHAFNEPESAERLVLPATRTQAATENSQHLERWAPLFADRQPEILIDPHWPTLAAQMDRIAGTGTDVSSLVDQAIAERALPTDNPARSLDYRLANAMPPSTGPRPHLEVDARAVSGPTPPTPATGPHRRGPSR